MSLLKMISSPYCAISEFVVIIRYTSVIAYMTSLDPLLSSLHSRFDGVKCRFNLGERRGSSSRFCLTKILGVYNEGKGRG